VWAQWKVDKLLKCSFCDKKIDLGTGKMFVLKSGVVRYFCSSKCERNWKLGRDAKNVKWTEIFRKKD
jgi:large subunit ribosomal protein L24e